MGDTMSDHDPIPEQSSALPEPLPPTRVLAGVEGTSLSPPIGGVIKARPDDFMVDELPLYEPCGEGEHLYLRVRKAGMAHVEVVQLLARHCGVNESAIGFAGMKDRHAVTEQTFSVHLPGKPDPEPPTHPRLSVVWAARHTNKLRRGHLAGNRFAIRVRQVDPTRAPAVLRGLKTLGRIGVPDFYGEQRFGYRFNNHRLGAMLLRGEWEPLLGELLGTTGSAFPEHQRERREMYDRGELEAAAPKWGPADRAERAAIGALLKGRTREDSVRAIGHTSLSFWISALQSAIFNHVLDRRLRGLGIDRLVEGDLAWKHSSRACFTVTAEELASGRLEERLQNFEISPSGPLVGPSMTTPTGEPARIEQEVMQEFGIETALFEHRSWGAEGARRPLRVHVANGDVDSGVDEHGPYIRTVFELPRGAYATVVLRELFGLSET